MDSKDYIEVYIKIQPFSQDKAEIVEAELSDLPYDMFQIQEDGIKAYIQRPLFDSVALKVVLSGLLFKTNYTTNVVPPQNWNKEWEDDFAPIVVGKAVTVKSVNAKNIVKTRFNIALNPNMAFGTGHHQTTYMMMSAMLKNEQSIKGKQVMDMGCGTGILAILAAKMGAEHVWGIDIDAVATRSAFDNAHLNRVAKKIELYCGDASLLQMGKYDVFLANIHRNIILMDLKTYAMALRFNGLLLLSGFYNSDEQSILQEAAKWGLEKVDSYYTYGGDVANGAVWCCLELKKVENIKVF